jgi:stage II sporulation protein D
VTGNINTINVLELYPSGRAKTIQFITPNGTFNKTYLADSMRSRLTTRSSLLTGIGRSGNDWVFNGRGFGHGIGMGQWGAYNQALQGRSYQQILQFYYTGVNFQGF